ncbi:hypothetical protein MLD38_009490 [Melastoma candidum]|uniref:Uncharacterized protein n=1 Tax=Melastoma candidum TaxID=119954 RepID=A0ACB9RXE7_9MYRT|nr:hypothetical protein MLD38_009490 [Melastoma candidum]
MAKAPQVVDFSLKETKPKIGLESSSADKMASTYDLVEQMQYLFVHVVKARDLPGGVASGSCDPYVEVKMGNYKGVTKQFEKRSNPEWNQVFAFAKERIQASVVEVTVKDKAVLVDDQIGKVAFDVNDIPKRVPPDSPLAPQWYRLEDQRGEKIEQGELMLAVWMGTQADEAFSHAWHSDAASVVGETIAHVRSKVYLSPRLWYLRLNVIEAQDLVPSDKSRPPEFFVKVVLGNQVLKTKISPSKTVNPSWNEDLLFVAAEPFDEPIVLTVENKLGANKEEILGRCLIPVRSVATRIDIKPVPSKWYNLEKHLIVAGEQKKEVKFASRIHLRICLEGGYHVTDESAHHSSDHRPSSKRLWKSAIGILELGILSANGLIPIKTRDGKGSTDAFCVAKYGHKWVRTRTIVHSLSPKWNQQYTWEVFDICTVVTIGVFDNGHVSPGGGGKDSRIGKVRIRLSTLESDRVYTHSYPLLVLHPSGVKKMGELHLAVRFTCSSWVNMLHMYSQPLLPKMHYLHPLPVIQHRFLRHHAMQIVATRLSRAEPALKREVVEYMLDADSHLWSMRRSKANFSRIMGVIQGLIVLSNWFHQICHWKNPVTSTLIHILLVILVIYPDLILPTLFIYLFVIGIWNLRSRPRHPPHMDVKLSHADAVHPDELDEEFDGFPTTKPLNTVRQRYDRLRTLAGHVQTVVGDLATQGERILHLLSWRDPRATAVFSALCLVCAVMFYVTPFRVIALSSGFYSLRHPRFRQKLPATHHNFFRRLPTRSDGML